MTTLIYTFFKSILVSQIISWGKWFIFSRIPDWTKAEDVRQFGLKNLPAIKKISDSTGIQWDDRIVAKLQTVFNDPVMFELIYSAIINESTARIETETVKQTLRDRIKARLDIALPEAVCETVADEVTPMINAVKSIKQLARQ